MDKSKENRNMLYAIIIIIIISVPFILLSYFSNPKRIEEKRKSAEDEKLLMEWFNNSGWENEVENIKVDYKYNKKYSDWKKIVHGGYGQLNIDINYNNKDYSFSISNKDEPNNDIRNAFIYCRLHYDEIRNYINRIIENYEDENYINMIKDDFFIDNKTSNNENAYIISDKYRIKIKTYEFIKTKGIRPNTSIEEAIKYFQDSGPEIEIKFNAIYIESREKLENIIDEFDKKLVEGGFSKGIHLYDCKDIFLNNGHKVYNPKIIIKRVHE